MPLYQFNIGASPELLYALAIILAALIGFIGQIIYRWLATRRSRKTLRQALLAEIETMSWLTRDDTNALQESIRNGEPLTTTHVPTDVYDSNITDVGLLPEKEAEVVIKYYNTAHIAQDQLNKIADAEGDTTNVRKVLADRTIPDLIESYDSVTDSLK